MSGAYEREVLMTGIGGQGVQLAGKILALAATRERLEVMSLGTYGGTMRGGNTDATVVIGKQPILSPPVVSRAWCAIVMHPRYFEPVAMRLREDALVLVDENLLEEALPPSKGTRIDLPATELARSVEAPKAAALVLLGAFVSASGILPVPRLDEALAEALPSYRTATLESNRRAIAAGAAAVAVGSVPAWSQGVA